VDDYSRGMWMYLLKDKSETFKCLVNFWSMANIQFGALIQQVRSDNGSDFTNSPLKEFFATKGIIHETFLRRYCATEWAGRMKKQTCS